MSTPNVIEPSGSSPAQIRVNGILRSFAEAQAEMARRLDPTGALGQAIREHEAEKVGVASGKRGPAFDGTPMRTVYEWTPYQRKLATAQAILRSGFELLLEAERGRELTAGERGHCVTEAAIAMRRADPDCYEDDKADAVGKTVEYFKGRQGMFASEDEIREIATEACSFMRVVEAKS